MTRVAECRRVETGVGPSMASSSQVNEMRDTDLTERDRSMMSCQYESVSAYLEARP